MKVVLDLETTGVRVGKDEVLQISIIDENKNILMNEYVKPTRHDSWEEAEKVNKISPEKVKNCKTLQELKEKILNILDNAELVIGYNIINFDMRMLKTELGIEKNYKLYDVMLEYAKYLSANGRWVSLGKACEERGIKLENAHDSLGDVRGTIDLYNAVEKAVKEGAKVQAKACEVDNKIFFDINYARRYCKAKGIDETQIKTLEEIIEMNITKETSADKKTEMLRQAVKRIQLPKQSPVKKVDLYGVEEKKFGSKDYAELYCRNNGIDVSKVFKIGGEEKIVEDAAGETKEKVSIDGKLTLYVYKNGKMQRTTQKEYLNRFYSNDLTKGIKVWGELKERAEKSDKKFQGAKIVCKQADGETVMYGIGLSEKLANDYYKKFIAK